MRTRIGGCQRGLLVLLLAGGSGCAHSAQGAATSRGGLLGDWDMSFTRCSGLVQAGTGGNVLVARFIEPHGKLGTSRHSVSLAEVPDLRGGRFFRISVERLAPHRQVEIDQAQCRRYDGRVW